MAEFRLLYSKSEAARVLCITRPTLDIKIAKGLLTLVSDEQGRQFIPGDDIREYYEGMLQRRVDTREKADRIIRRNEEKLARLNGKA